MEAHVAGELSLGEPLTENEEAIEIETENGCCSSIQSSSQQSSSAKNSVTMENKKIESVNAKKKRISARNMGKFLLCPQCPNVKKMSNPMEVMEHYSKHLTVDLYGCHECLKCYGSKEELIAHPCPLFTVSHLTPSSFGICECHIVCVVCGSSESVGPQKQYNKMHFAKITSLFDKHSPDTLILLRIFFAAKCRENERKLMFSSPLKPPVKMTCHDCKIKFKTTNCAEDHIAQIHNKSPYSCPLRNCETSSDTKEERILHVASHLPTAQLALFMTKAVAQIKEHIVVKPYDFLVREDWKHITEDELIFTNDNNAKKTKNAPTSNLLITRDGILEIDLSKLKEMKVAKGLVQKSEPIKTYISVTFSGGTLQEKTKSPSVFQCQSCNSIIYGTALKSKHWAYCTAVQLGRPEFTEIYQKNGVRNKKIVCYKCEINVCSIEGLKVHFLIVHNLECQTVRNGGREVSTTPEPLELEVAKNDMRASSTPMSLSSIEEPSQLDLIVMQIDGQTGESGETSEKETVNKRVLKEKELDRTNENILEQEENCGQMSGDLVDMEIIEILGDGHPSIRVEPEDKNDKPIESSVVDDEIFLGDKSIVTDTPEVVISEPEVKQVNQGDDECMLVSEVTNSRKNYKVRVDKKQVNCASCSLKFVTTRGLYEHRQATHKHDFDDLCKQDFGVPLKTAFWLCRLCYAGFETEERYSKHIEMHKKYEQKIHDCAHCSGIMVSTEEMMKHKIYHSKNSFHFHCTLCPGVFSFQTDGTYFNHLKNVHKMQLILYCKRCCMATIDVSHQFAKHFSACTKRFSMEKKMPASLIGVCVATIIRFQPKDEQKFAEFYKQNQKDFAAITHCSHATLIYAGNSFATCDEPNCGALMQEALYRAHQTAKNNGVEVELTVATTASLSASCIYSNMIRKIDEARNKMKKKAIPPTGVENEAPLEKIMRLVESPTPNIPQSLSTVQPTSTSIVPITYQPPYIHHLPASQFQHQQQQKQLVPRTPPTLIPTPRIPSIVVPTTSPSSSLSQSNQSMMPWHPAQAEANHEFVSRPPPILMQTTSPSSSLPQSNQSMMSWPSAQAKANFEFAIRPSPILMQTTPPSSSLSQSNQLTMPFPQVQAKGNHEFASRPPPFLMPTTSQSSSLSQSNQSVMPWVSAQAIANHEIVSRLNQSVRNVPPTTMVPAGHTMNFSQGASMEPQGPCAACSAYTSVLLYCPVRVMAAVPLKWEEKVWKNFEMNNAMGDVPPDPIQFKKAVYCTARNNFFFICIRHFIAKELIVADGGLKYTENQRFFRNFSAACITIYELHMNTCIRDSIVSNMQHHISDLQKRSLCRFEKCQAPIDSYEALLFHQAHNPTKNNFCVGCNDYVPIQDEMGQAAHFFTYHLRETLSFQYNLKCPAYCRAEYTSMFDFLTHINSTHESLYRYRSYTCALAFKTAEKREEHSAKHAKTRTFECCFLCGNTKLSLSSNGYQVNHFLLHCIKTRLQCKVCLVKADPRFELLRQKLAMHTHFEQEHADILSMCCVKCSDQNMRQEHIFKTHMVKHFNIPSSRINGQLTCTVETSFD